MTPKADSPHIFFRVWPVAIVNLSVVSDTLILHSLWVSVKSDVCIHTISLATAFNSLLLKPCDRAGAQNAFLTDRQPVGGHHPASCL